jgi:general secretion pathway protein A
MYTTYWKLAARPFDNHVDPDFYYPSETHQATLLKLRYAIENRRGGALMAAAAGLGKTLLVQALFEDLPEEYAPLIHLQFPQMSPAQLLAFLAEELTGRPAENAPPDQSLHRIRRALKQNDQDGRHAVVVIDEAHLLRDTEAMETVRLLLNFASSWTLFLVAQPSLLPALERMPELEERLGVKCLLRHFSLDETAGYIRHRMAAAAGNAHAVFEAEALEAIHQLSGGIPRRINRLCDLSLLIGFAEEQAKITANHVEAVAEELIHSAASERQAA